MQGNFAWPRPVHEWGQCRGPDIDFTLDVRLIAFLLCIIFYVRAACHLRQCERLRQEGNQGTRVQYVDDVYSLRSGDTRRIVLSTV